MKTQDIPAAPTALALVPRDACAMKCRGLRVSSPVMRKGIRPAKKMGHMVAWMRPKRLHRVQCASPTWGFRRLRPKRRGARIWLRTELVPRIPAEPITSNARNATADELPDHTIEILDLALRFGLFVIRSAFRRRRPIWLRLPLRKFSGTNDLQSNSGLQRPRGSRLRDRLHSK